VRRPLIKDDEKGLILRGLNENWVGFWDFVFWGNGRRRGVHVNVPEIGSRVGYLCFWGNLGFYAVLRRECGQGIGFW
jgi:hypothetical protein